MEIDGAEFRSFLICQTSSGPRMLPNGMMKPASALRWQSMFQVRAWLSGEPGDGVEGVGWWRLGRRRSLSLVI